MKNKVKRVEDLPDWFNLKKYAGLVSHGASQWAEAIHTRLGIEYFLSAAPEPKLIQRLDQLFASPLETWGASNHPGKPDDPENLVFGTIECMNIRQAANIHAEWDRLTPEMVEAIAQDDFSRATPEQERLIAKPFELSTGYEPDGMAGIPTINVDLAAPDDVLVRDFKRWIAAARVAFEWQVPERMVTRETMQTWIDLQVLPYFDLHLWSLHTSTEIPLHVLGEALFPDDYDGNLAERRTVRKKVREVINYHMAESLRLQAALKS